MSGPAWECNPERLANGRIIYRCMFGHFHGDKGAAWSCGGPYDRQPGDPSEDTSLDGLTDRQLADEMATWDY